LPLKPFIDGPAFKVLAYERSNASCQVAEYLDSLNDRNRKRVAALLDHSATNGPPRNKEKCRKVAGEGFWEFKAHQQRIFWCYGPRKQIVLLHGFTKKSNDTPKRELASARQAYGEAQQELSAMEEEGSDR